MDVMFGICIEMAINNETVQMKIVTEVKQIKMIEGGHLTASNRRDIRNLINLKGDYFRNNTDDNLLKLGKGRKLAYRVTYLDGNQYRICILENYRDDWNRPQIRKHTHIIEVK